MDVFRKCLHVFDILHDCVDRSCVCQLSSNEYMMMIMMMMMMMPSFSELLYFALAPSEMNFFKLSLKRDIMLQAECNSCH